MRKICTLCLFVLSIFTLTAQNNVGIGTPTPDPSALLELKSTSMGILIPRMTAVERTTIAAPQNGLMVYDTDSSCFYYYNNSVTAWSSLCQTGSATPVTNIPWYIVGNAATGASTSPIGSAANNNFIGPTDNNAFVIATDNFERLRVTGSASTGVYNTSTDGLVGIGTNNPTDKLHIASINTAIALQDINARTWRLISESQGRFRIADQNSSATRFELNPSGNGTAAIVDNTSTLLSSGAPAATLHIDAGAGNTSDVRLTNGTTGATVTDGLDIGSLTSSDAFIRQYENAALVTYTNNIERQRILATGATSFNLTVPVSGAVVSAYGKSYPGVLGAPGDTAIAGFSSGDNGIGIYGENDNSLGTVGAGVGVFGTASTPPSIGVYGQNTADLSALTGALAIGVYGTCIGNSATGNYPIGVVGYMPNSPSIGMLGVANNQTPLFLPSGGLFVSDEAGMVAEATDFLSGIAGEFIGNGLTFGAFPLVGAGAIGNGYNYGTMGFAYGAINTDGVGNTYDLLGPNAAAGGYFEVDDPILLSAVSWTYVAAQGVSGTAQKVIGNGTVNTIVKDTADHFIALSCPEAPENLFQDLGKGQLKNGTVHITLDPNFSKNIAVNADHDLRVFVQLKGDCKGVYVSNETQYGFDVTEISGGQSNTPFTWMVMANRADEILANGVSAKYSVERFPAAPGPQQKKIQQLSPVSMLGLKKTK